MYIYWILLGLAIATEITGTLSMKWASVSEGNGGFILMLVMISLSYIFLSFAVKKIALGVAYALWEGIDENCRVNHPGRRDCIDQIRYP